VDLPLSQCTTNHLFLSFVSCCVLRHRDLQDLQAYEEEGQHGYFRQVEIATQKRYFKTFFRLVLFLTRMTEPLDDGEQVEGFVAATLPEEILQAATVLRENHSQDNLHSLLTATFAPLEPTVPRNGHCVAHFVHLMIRSSDGIYLSIPAISQICVGLQHAIRLVCFEDLSRRRPATEDARTAILKMVKITYVGPLSIFCLL